MAIVANGKTIKSETSLEQLVSEMASESAANIIEHAMRGFNIINAGESSQAKRVYHSLLFVQDTQISFTNNLPGDDVSDITFPAGVMIYGAFTDLTVSTGQCLAYVFGDHA